VFLSECGGVSSRTEVSRAGRRRRRGGENKAHGLREVVVTAADAVDVGRVAAAAALVAIER
jgi:hypothetical protein